jgi:hypothetical protein
MSRSSGRSFGEFVLEPQELLDFGDQVVAVVLMRGRGKGSGVTLEDLQAPFAVVWTSFARGARADVSADLTPASAAKAEASRASGETLGPRPFREPVMARRGGSSSGRAVATTMRCALDTREQQHGERCAPR